MEYWLKRLLLAKPAEPPAPYQSRDTKSDFSLDRFVLEAVELGRLGALRPPRWASACGKTRSRTNAASKMRNIFMVCKVVVSKGRSSTKLSCVLAKAALLNLV